MISLSDLLTTTPRAQTIEEVHTGEDQEESADRFDKDILDNPRHVAAASTVNEEEELNTGNTQLDRSF